MREHGAVQGSGARCRLSGFVGYAYLLKISFTNNGEVKTPNYKTWWQLIVIKNNAKACISPTSASSFSSVHPLIKKEATESDSS